MSKTIVILGSSFAGIAVAHKLLKQTLPAAPGFKVVMVSPTTHHYWNLASVRAIIPGQLSDTKVFQAVEPGFKSYPAGSFEFVVGSATGIDTTAKSVTISTPSGEKTQKYDILVLASGSRTVGEVPWKQSPSGTEATKELLHKIQDQVKAAKSIVVGGAGPTGVEVTGELAFEYGQTKTITLVTAGKDLVVGGLTTPIAAVAEKELKKLNVKVVKNTKITGSKTLGDGKTELILDNGETMTCDLYLPTVGVVPNTEYVPKTLLSDKGYVMVDEFLRVKSVSDVWAAGDVIDAETPQLVHTQKQALALSKNLDLVLKGKDPVPYKIDASPMLAVTLGRSKGTGRAGNMKLPSIMVWFLKGRTLLAQKLPEYVSGSAF